MKERPRPGTENEFIHGMYLPPSKLTFLMRSFPVSFGTSIPGEPFVGGALQSEAALTTAGGGGVPAAAVVAGGGGLPETQASAQAPSTSDTRWGLRIIVHAPSPSPRAAGRG